MSSRLRPQAHAGLSAILALCAIRSARRRDFPDVATFEALEIAIVRGERYRQRDRVDLMTGWTLKPRRRDLHHKSGRMSDRLSDLSRGFLVTHRRNGEPGGLRIQQEFKPARVAPIADAGARLNLQFAVTDWLATGWASPGHEKRTCTRSVRASLSETRQRPASVATGGHDGSPVGGQFGIVCLGLGRWDRAHRGRGTPRAPRLIRMRFADPVRPLAAWTRRRVVAKSHV
jgi:hypothetical protein